MGKRRAQKTKRGRAISLLKTGTKRSDVVKQTEMSRATVDRVGRLLHALQDSEKIISTPFYYPKRKTEVGTLK